MSGNKIDIYSSTLPDPSFNPEIKSLNSEHTIRVEKLSSALKAEDLEEISPIKVKLQEFRRKLASYFEPFYSKITTGKRTTTDRWRFPLYFSLTQEGKVSYYSRADALRLGYKHSLITAPLNGNDALSTRKREIVRGILPESKIKELAERRFLKREVTPFLEEALKFAPDDYTLKLHKDAFESDRGVTLTKLSKAIQDLKTFLKKNPEFLLPSDNRTNLPTYFNESQLQEAVELEEEAIFKELSEEYNSPQPGSEKYAELSSYIDRNLKLAEDPEAQQAIQTSNVAAKVNGLFSEENSLNLILFGAAAAISGKSAEDIQAAVAQEKKRKEEVESEEKFNALKVNLRSYNLGQRLEDLFTLLESPTAHKIQHVINNFPEHFTNMSDKLTETENLNSKLEEAIKLGRPVPNDGATKVRQGLAKLKRAKSLIDLHTHFVNRPDIQEKAAREIASDKVQERLKNTVGRLKDVFPEARTFLDKLEMKQMSPSEKTRYEEWQNKLNPADKRDLNKNIIDVSSQDTAISYHQAIAQARKANFADQRLAKANILLERNSDFVNLMQQIKPNGSLPPDWKEKADASVKLYEELQPLWHEIGTRKEREFSAQMSALAKTNTFSDIKYTPHDQRKIEQILKPDSQVIKALKKLAEYRANMPTSQSLKTEYEDLQQYVDNLKTAQAKITIKEVLTEQASLQKIRDEIAIRVASEDRNIKREAFQEAYRLYSQDIAEFKKWRAGKLIATQDLSAMIAKYNQVQDELKDSSVVLKHPEYQKALAAVVEEEFKHLNDFANENKSVPINWKLRPQFEKKLREQAKLDVSNDPTLENLKPGERQKREDKRLSELLESDPEWNFFKNIQKESELPKNWEVIAEGWDKINRQLESLESKIPGVDYPKLIVMQNLETGYYGEADYKKALENYPWTEADSQAIDRAIVTLQNLKQKVALYQSTLGIDQKEPFDRIDKRTQGLQEIKNLGEKYKTKLEESKKAPTAQIKKEEKKETSKTEISSPSEISVSKTSSSSTSGVQQTLEGELQPSQRLANETLYTIGNRTYRLKSINQNQTEITPEIELRIKEALDQLPPDESLNDLAITRLQIKIEPKEENTVKAEIKAFKAHQVAFSLVWNYSAKTVEPLVYAREETPWVEGTEPRIQIVSSKYEWFKLPVNKPGRFSSLVTISNQTVDKSDLASKLGLEKREIDNAIKEKRLEQLIETKIEERANKVKEEADRMANGQIELNLNVYRRFLKENFDWIEQIGAAWVNSDNQDIVKNALQLVSQITNPKYEKYLLQLQDDLIKRDNELTLIK